MTRINVGYPVEKLTDKHLLAEHREIKRIPNAVRTGKARLENIPEKFCLGKGHVKFFYNKMGYLWKRYVELFSECHKRGFKIQDYENSWNDIPDELWGYYTPTEQDKKLIEDRINQRLSKI